MLEKLKHTFALSDQGAKDMVKAFFACILHNFPNGSGSTFI